MRLFWLASFWHDGWQQMDWMEWQYEEQNCLHD